MDGYLVERRIPGLDREQVAAVQRSLMLAARRSGVRYVRTTWLPGEEKCLCFFEALGVEDVQRINDMAQVPFAWIAPAIDLRARGVAVR